MEKYKKILEKKDLYIQFTDEEMAELKWEEGQKLSVSYDEETGSISLSPYVKVDIDITTWDRLVLEFLITESCNKDISCNQVIEDYLRSTITTKKEKKEQLLCEDYEK